MEDSLFNVLKAYSIITGEKIYYDLSIDSKLWLEPPAVGNRGWPEWSILYYQRLILLLQPVYYIYQYNVHNITYEEALHLLSTVWSAYVKSPGSLIGPWLAHIICAPITQKSLDSIHQKMSSISENTHKNTLSLLFTGKKIHPQDPLIFMDEETNEIITVQRPVDVPLDHKLIPMSITTILVWELTTQRLQLAIQKALDECGDSDLDSNMRPAVRLISNIITTSGRIDAINRSNIPHDRDVISQSLFEVPSKYLIKSLSTHYQPCAPSGQFCLGVEGKRMGVLYSDVIIK